jgi:hypothetical protein
VWRTPLTVSVTVIRDSSGVLCVDWPRQHRAFFVPLGANLICAARVSKAL